MCYFDINRVKTVSSNLVTEAKYECLLQLAECDFEDK